jgi:hypothetical protein
MTITNESDKHGRKKRKKRIPNLTDFYVIKKLTILFGR